MKRKQYSTSLITSAATIAASAFIILSSLEQKSDKSSRSRVHQQRWPMQPVLRTVNGDTTAAAATITKKNNFHASSREENLDGMELERYHQAVKRPNHSSSSSRNAGRSPGGSGTNHQNDDNVIIVATIDGTFYGLSRTNGEIMWVSNKKDHNNDSFNSGRSGDKNVNNNSHHRMQQKHQKHETSSKNTENQTQTNTENESVVFAPLITTSTTRSSTKSSWKTSAVPSIDGKVFLTLGGIGGGRAAGEVNTNRDSADATNRKQSRKDLVHYAIADTTITTNMKDLVNRSPFMDSRGRFYVSSKESYVIALDRDTGDVVKVINRNSEHRKNQADDCASRSNDGKYGQSDINDRIERYNNNNDDVNDIFKDDNVFCEYSDHYEGYCERNEKSAQDRNLIWMGRIDYSVTVHDARTGEIDVQFSTSEVLSWEDMVRKIDSGDKSGLHDQLDTFPPLPEMLTLPTGDEDSEDFVQIGGNIQHNTNSFSGSKIVTTPGGKVALCDKKSEKVLWIADDTFETPVAFALESSSGSSIGVEVVPDAPSSDSFSKEYLSSKLEANGVNDDPFFGDNTKHAMGGTVFGALQSGQLFALTLGRQSSGTNQRLLDGLPHKQLLSSTVASNKHSMGNFLMWSGHNDWKHENQDPVGKDDKAFAVALKNDFCDRRSATYQQCLLDYYIRRNNYLMFESGLAATPDEDFFQNMVNPEPRPEPKFSFLFKLMTSWLPAAMALAFIFFELGRRQKLKLEAKLRHESSVESTDMPVGSTPKELSTSVIDVSDEVLGYGGHGTVVYRGKLEGRAVAVKRMLKAYHASADREISLLIESDGHPNVVRYFLKEVRGDFVYLALELCDMNLQDLIGVLTRNQMKSMLTQSGNRAKLVRPIDKATKQILFEIASGVKHIHSLRIVHRDLKPANILLARKHRNSKTHSQDSIFETFQDQNFVVKISDMGLGKQLVGQSSFGMSTINNSIGMSMSRNDGSTIAGAGPGSVGWQAPEVMAHRLSPESPRMQDESSGPEAMLEASPIDASINGRTSRSVDIFSLGCIFYCTILPGSHPFGEWYEREANIMKNCPSTKALENVTVDAADLILSMLHRNPQARPNAKQICNHPFFWSPMKRLSFFCDLSDRLERLESIDSQTPLEYLIEKNAVLIVGTAWDTKVDQRLFNNVLKFRTYDPSSVRDCLRLMRNKSHHFDELPNDLREKIATTQEELVIYFESLFPMLLMHCFRTCRDNLAADDEIVAKYDIPISVLKCNNKGSNHLYKHLDNGINTTSSSQSPKIKISRSCNEEDESKGQLHSPLDVVIWENSSAANTYKCRGWMRSQEEWVRGSKKVKKVDAILIRCAEDGKFRTRLCNHWDKSLGTFCPLCKKNKCDFAHGPVELRVKEGKRSRWGKLVDPKGNCSNPNASGGEDTYGAARSIELARKEEGKWNTGNIGKKQCKKGKKKAVQK